MTAGQNDSLGWQEGRNLVGITFQYIDGVTPHIEQSGARNLLSDDNAVILEGDWEPATLVIHDFASRAALQEFWDSPDSPSPSDPIPDKIRNQQPAGPCPPLMPEFYGA
ncbi:DUF1330 domain-containing protein [Streptomyces sp. NPDC056479]|uniref:DUF1330 domain-containing protein n=1 Tax=Streptomyces sp. NPDC056479 TaxID=3345832 RepID=UPI0036A4268D